MSELFIISTCNRTEIYGIGSSAERLADLLLTQTNGDKRIFFEQAYLKESSEAVEHLFNVGAGLDSQILGDYEVIGQLKQAVKFSKERGGIKCFLERFINVVLQSSKEIKRETALSGGTVSVSFAAVQYLKQHIRDFTDMKILVVGIGKIGRNTCKNLVDYLGTKNITLINRSEEKAKQLAEELNLKYAPIAQLQKHVQSSDIILVATNAAEPTILKSYLCGNGKKIIIDLSIPYNVEASVNKLPGIKLIIVDEISKMKDDTIRMRELEVPKAKCIIQKHIATFAEWQLMRQNASTLKAIKTLLNDIAMRHQQELDNPHTQCPYIAAEQKIQQVINKIAGKMRVQNHPGCYHLEAISEFIKTTK